MRRIHTDYILLLAYREANVMFSIVGISVFSRSSGSTGPQSHLFIREPTFLQEYIQTSSQHNPQVFLIQFILILTYNIHLFILLLVNLTVYLLILYEKRVQLEGLSYNHTKWQVERQAAHQAARSHWNALWCSKMGLRSIPKHHGKRQNSKASACHLMLYARCGCALSACPLPSWGLVVLVG